MCWICNSEGRRRWVLGGRRVAVWPLREKCGSLLRAPLPLCRPGGRLGGWCSGEAAVGHTLWSPYHVLPPCHPSIGLGAIFFALSGCGTVTSSSIAKLSLTHNGTGALVTLFARATLRRQRRKPRRRPKRRPRRRPRRRRSRKRRRSRSRKRRPRRVTIGVGRNTPQCPSRYRPRLQRMVRIGLLEGSGSVKGQGFRVAGESGHCAPALEADRTRSLLQAAHRRAAPSNHWTCLAGGW